MPSGIQAGSQDHDSQYGEDKPVSERHVALPLKTWPATLVNAATGSFSFAVGSADTIAFAAGAYIYDVECTTPGQRTVGATGQLNLFQAIGQ